MRHIKEGGYMFKDRFDAGKKLAEKLQKYLDNAQTVILAVPRGALEIGAVLSRELHAPLDVILTKKIGYPGNADYAIGGVSLDNVIIDKRALEFSGELELYLKKEISEIRQLLRERSKAYHQDRLPISLENKIVIVTDDGIATGKTLEVTIDLIKKQRPAKIIIAVPVASKEAMQRIKKKVDEVICLEVPDVFISVGQWYDHFNQIDDEQSIELLQASFVQ